MLATLRRARRKRVAANPTPSFDNVTSTQLPLGELAPADFDFLYRLWLAKRGQRLAPARAEFDPAELRAMLPRLLLIDVAHDPPDFRYRLAGTLTYELHGQELTGKSITALKPPEFVATLWHDLRELVARAEPQLVQLDFTNQEGYHRAYHVLRLPLSSDGKTIDMILVLVDYGLDRG
jgi:hypothetical protein